jgi:hypothetical protein
MLARIVRRWLFILLAVVLSGWFSPTVALARSLRPIPHYDAVVAMEKVVLVKDLGTHLPYGLVWTPASNIYVGT